jgi:hypothetical protein
VANTINGVRNMEAVMAEEWAPQRQDVQQVYLKDVLRCPIYLGLFAKIYSDPTRREYEAALANQNTEILLYLKNCPESEREGPLRELIQRFEAYHVPTRFQSPAELMTAIPRHLDAAVERMIEKLLRLGEETTRSLLGPRARRVRQAQEALLEAWDVLAEPDEMVHLLHGVRADLRGFMR